MTRVLITGADGFVARNLRLHLSERADIEILTLTRLDPVQSLRDKLRRADVVFHLAGVNRPEDPAEFSTGNADLTRRLAQELAALSIESGRRVPVVYTSSIQAALANPYGLSKRAAEQALFQLAESHAVPVHVFRLPNVFGKWCRPNYNSVVATFCHNLARDLPIQIKDFDAPLTLVYVDDLMAVFMEVLDGKRQAPPPGAYAEAGPTYTISVGTLAEKIRSFRAGRDSLYIDKVGTGLTRALYATYVSYLPVEAFSYPVPVHADARGVFVEMLKTPDAGQFSFLTAAPGVTRGGHYHHTKTEKFLVIRGQARFRFRHMQTGAMHELITSGDQPQVVETVPGWTHDITNLGSDDLIVMLWANEIFDRDRPDTVRCPV